MQVKKLINKFSKEANLELYPDALIVINASNDIVGWNSKSESIFGYIENEIIGRNIGILFDTEVEKIRTSIYTKENQILTAKNRNGDDIIVEIACNEYSRGGKTIISIRNVTKSQKVIENLLLEYKKVSKIAGHKSGFVAGYSNELKNPIHSIIGFSQGMLDGVCGDLDEKQAKYISIINKNSNNLLSLIENIITLSKIETDQIQPVYKVFDVAELLESVKSDIGHLIHEKNISFEIDCRRIERKNIYSDENLLRQILLNLYTNAVKFTEVGQIKVELTYPDSQTVKSAGIKPLSYFTDKSYILFSISDTGIGISEEDKQRIFDEYNQSNKIMIKKYGGTGLGLAITKKITAILNGNIWVQSNFNKGTTFNFIIPVERIITPLMPKSE